ncbi:hypothetical protein MnTg02_00202 [bacterium MnTg02]|nr:hypothetical protein MnTg02_00202 [bacterium MnTg02]
MAGSIYTLFRSIAAMAAVFLAVSWSGPAVAAVCSASIFAAITNHVGCQIGATGANDSDTQLDDDNLFSLSNGWTEINKVESFPGSEGALMIDNIVLNSEIPQELVGGRWSIDNVVWDTYSTIALIFKDGNQNVSPDAYVAYQILEDTEASETTGTFVSPFTNLNNDNLKGVSHITLYGNLAAVPLPAAFWLFGSALSLMGFAGWRRKRMAATA